MIYNERGVAQMSKINNQKYIKLFQTVCEAPINAPKEAFELLVEVFIFITLTEETCNKQSRNESTSEIRRVAF